VQVRFISFGRIEVDGTLVERDLVIERGRMRKRKKKPSKPRRAEFGHTPLTSAEAIPWSAPTLIIGTGANGQLPITDDLRQAAAERGVEVVAVPTEAACRLISAADPDRVSAILHVTC